MTIVVWREGKMYSDEMAIIGVGPYIRAIPKAVKDPLGDLLYVFGGDIPHADELPAIMRGLREWWQRWYFGANQQGGLDNEQIKQYRSESSIHICWNTGMVRIDERHPQLFGLDDVMEGGNGGTWALAALDAGLGLEEVADFVRGLDASSGLNLRCVDVTTELAAPINEHDIALGSVEPIPALIGAVTWDEGVVIIRGDELAFPKQLGRPWMGTGRCRINLDDCYTQYGYFIPHGLMARLFLDYCVTGHLDGQLGIQGTNAGVLISSDGMIYDVMFYGENSGGVAKLDSRPGRFEVRPIWKWWDDFHYVGGVGHISQYTYALGELGKGPRETLAMCDKRLAAIPSHAYTHHSVKGILEELKRRETPPFKESDLRNVLDYKKLSEYLTARDTYFTEEQCKKYEL